VSARDHRSEIVLLVALVVLTALGLGLGVLLTSGDDASPEADEATALPSASASPGDESEPAEVAPAVAVGPDAFVYACQLVPRADVERIFGAFGPEGRTRQTYLTRTPTAGEPVAPAARQGAGLSTSCDHTIGDPAGHTLEVDVSQYPTGAALARRWAALREDGDPVRGTDAMVSLPAKRSFVLRADPVLVEVRYSTFGDLARDRPMSGRERGWQERRMRAVQRAVAGHLADGTAVDGPAPTSTGGATYPSPCAVLTDAVLRAAGGPPSGPVDVDSSYLPRDPYADVPVATCERRGTQRGVTTFAVLEVRVAATPQQAREAEAKHLDNRYPRRAKVREVRSTAGPAYVADLGGFAEWPWRSRSIQAVVGRYELHLSVLRDVTKERPYGRWVSEDELVAAMNAMVSDPALEPVP
jgi:hypothetical protein